MRKVVKKLPHGKPKGLEYTFEVEENGKRRTLTIEGKDGITSKQGEVLVALVKAGERGITNFDPAYLGCLELRDYRYRLATPRNRFKLDIESRDEAHKGGMHVRYFLRSKVRIVKAPKTPTDWV